MGETLTLCDMGLAQASGPVVAQREAILYHT